MKTALLIFAVVGTTFAAVFEERFESGKYIYCILKITVFISSKHSYLAWQVVE